MEVIQLAWIALQRIAELLPADAKSPGSDLTVPRYRSEAFWGTEGAINLLLYLSCTGLNPIQEEEVRNFFLLKAQLRNYEGRWKFVADLCNERTFAPVQLLSLVLREEGPHAFFGNRIQNIVKVGHQLRWDPIRFTEKSWVRPVERERGHDDKGSSRKKAGRLDGATLKPTLDKPVQSIHTLFFSNYPIGKKKTNEVYFASATTPTSRTKEETHKEAIEKVEELRKTIQTLRILPIPKNRKDSKKVRKLLKQSLVLSQDAIVLLSEFDDLLQLEAQELSIEKDEQTQNRDDRTLTLELDTSLQLLPELFEYFGVFDLGPIPRKE